MNELKTNSKQTRQRGTTLIELSVVIAVILLLVGVLFIGVTGWKNGANRAACLVNLSSIQKAVRGYENMNLLSEGYPLSVDTLQEAGFWQITPRCPTGSKYNFLPIIPFRGQPYASCDQPGHSTRDLEGRGQSGQDNPQDQ